MTSKNGQTIILDGITIPYAIYKGEKYYPLKYVFEKFLLKGNLQLHKKEEFKNYIEKLEIDWTFKGTAPQEGKCMNKKGWKLYLDNCMNNKYKTEDKAIRYNLWCDYIGSNNKTKSSKDVIPFNDYEKDCVNNYIKSHPNFKYKKCVNCNRNLPDSTYFFVPNNRYSKNIHTTENTCRLCNKNNKTNYRLSKDLTIKNKELVDSYKYFGNKGYKTLKNNIVKFYIKYVHNNSYNYSIHLNNKEELFLILKYYNNKLFDFKNINIKMLSEIFNKYINNFRSLLNLNELIEVFSNNDCLIRPYKYKYYSLGKISIDKARKIIDTYLIDKDIIINNIFDFNYSKLLRECRLTQFENNILDFIVKLYYNQYAGYKFTTSSVNYYKNINNRIFDMKYLIEKDLKIQIEKIPLYITRRFLHENYSPLYLILNKSYYNNNIFKWINECYPNKFIEKDFDINKYRIEFDSMEESQVDRVLREYCDNVIYNIRNSKNEVCINGYKPDWLIISNNGCYIVEYFGMYLKGGQEYKERLEKYKYKTELKIKKYKELEQYGYKTLYIFPEDLKNNYEGLINKLIKIK